MCVLLQEHTENHADDPTWWWTLVDYLKAHHVAGRLPRRVRLMIIIGLAAAAVLGGLAVSIIGSREVNSKVDDLRQAASTATVDPELVALTANGTDSDPVSEALGSDRVVSLQQQIDNRWCVETEVSALLSSRTMFFMIDDDGQFVETPACRG